MRPSVLIAEPEGFSALAKAQLEEVADVELRRIGAAELRAAFERYDVVWVRLAHRVDAKTVAPPARCRVLVSPTTGLDHLNLQALAEAGVELVSLKGEAEFLKDVRATAEHTLALLLALVRKLPPAASHAGAGAWQRDLFRGHELYQKTAGVVGLGRLGTIVSAYLSALGMRVLGYDPHAATTPLSVERVARLEDLLPRVDVLTLHASYDTSTHHLIDGRALGALRPGAWLINTARGGLLDTRALLDALKSERLSGAALDVIEGEPSVPGELASFARAHPDRLILTPHIGGNTHESLEKVEVHLARKTAALLRRIWP